MNNGKIFLKGLYVCLDDRDCTARDLGISQSTIVVFRKLIVGLGEQKIKVTAKNKDVNTIQQHSIFAEDKPDASIGDVIFPYEIEWGPDFDIGFSVFKNSLSRPMNVTIEFRFNDMVKSWDIDELSSAQEFRITIDKSLLDTRNNEFIIKAVYHDRNNMQYNRTDERQIIIKDPGFIAKIEIWLNSISRAISRFFGQR